MKVLMIGLCVLFLGGTPLFAQTHKVQLEISSIPMAKGYAWPGTLSVDEHQITFVPSLKGEVADVSLSYSEIVSVYTNSGLANRMVIETATHSHVFFTYKAKELTQSILEKLSSPAQETLHGIVLLKRIPFFFPLVTDHPFEGSFHMSNGQVVWKSIDPSGTLLPIPFAAESVDQIKVRRYWFFAKNRLVIKTQDGDRYQFVMMNPERTKTAIERSLGLTPIP